MLSDIDYTAGMLKKLQDAKVLVNGHGPTGVAGGPAGYATLAAYSAVTANGIKVTVPALGAVCLVIDKK